MSSNNPITITFREHRWNNLFSLDIVQIFVQCFKFQIKTCLLNQPHQKQSRYLSCLVNRISRTCASDCMFLSCHVRVSEWIYTLCWCNRESILEFYFFSCLILSCKPINKGNSKHDVALLQKSVISSILNG